MQTTIRKSKGCTQALAALGHAIGFAHRFAGCLDMSPVNSGAVTTS
jgi:hypothetical protein